MEEIEQMDDLFMKSVKQSMTPKDFNYFLLWYQQGEDIEKKTQGEQN